METHSMIKFNVGCGKRNFGPDWVHVDGAKWPHIAHNDIWYLCTPLDYIDLIYSSHFIAYFNIEQLNYLLQCWYKVLRPGGTLRLATPDFNILSKMYQVGVELEKLIGPLHGKMEMNEEQIYHKTTFDEKTLTQLLIDNSFINVRRYDHTKTEHPNTGGREDFFDDCSCAYLNGTLISLNLECSKPL